MGSLVCLTPYLVGLCLPVGGPLNCLVGPFDLPGGAGRQFACPHSVWQHRLLLLAYCLFLHGLQWVSRDSIQNLMHRMLQWSVIIL